MTDTLQAQIEAIEAANAGEASELEPGAGEQDTNVNDEAENADNEADNSDEAIAGPEDEGSDDDNGEAPDGDDEGDEAEEGSDEEPKRRRSKPASARIAELTAKLREAERRAERLEAEQREQQDTEQAEAPTAPNAADFEYGESDPKFIDAMTDYKIAKRDHERAVSEGESRKQAREAERRQAMQEQFAARLEKAEAEAQAKYPDFDEKIAAASAARGNQPLPPVVSVGVATSPVAGDVVYRLATDNAASDRIEAAAGRSPHAVALAIGELEAEYLEADDDGDLNPADPLDMARMNGRLRGRLMGKKPAQPEVRPTEAPEPPAKRAKGGAGRAKVGVDTDDMKAFMREFGKDLGR